MVGFYPWFYEKPVSSFLRIWAIIGNGVIVFQPLGYRFYGCTQPKFSLQETKILMVEENSAKDVVMLTPMGETVSPVQRMESFGIG